MLQHSARVQNSLEGSSAACPPNPVSVSSRSGCSTAACAATGESPFPRITVPAPSHRQEWALLTSCSLGHISSHFTSKETQGSSHNPQSLTAQTPVHWLVSVNQLPGSALWIIFPDFPEAMFYLHNLPLRKFFEVPFEIIWSGGKPSFAFIFFPSSPTPLGLHFHHSQLLPGSALAG